MVNAWGYYYPSTDTIDPIYLLKFSGDTFSAASTLLIKNISMHKQGQESYKEKDLLVLFVLKNKHSKKRT